MDYIRFRGVPTEHLIQRGPYSRRGCTVEGAQQYFQFRGGHTVLSVQRGPYSTVNLVQREHYNSFSLEKAIQFNQFGPYSSFRLEEAIQYSQFRGGHTVILVQRGPVRRIFNYLLPFPPLFFCINLMKYSEIRPFFKTPLFYCV